MKYKITVQNLTDSKDKFEMEGDAVMLFVGRANEMKKQIEHGMGFAGHKRVMKEIIATIPAQINQFVAEEISRENAANQPGQSKIIKPNGKHVN